MTDAIVESLSFKIFRTNRQASDLLETAWFLIAIATDWDSVDSAEWRVVAEQWRHEYLDTTLREDK